MVLMAAARGPLLMSVYICILGLMCCESVADSRPVYNPHYRDRKPPVDDEGLDEGPVLFTMQDHYNLLRERDMARRARAEERRTHQAIIPGTALNSVEPDRAANRHLIFVNDYGCTAANKVNDPTESCPPAR